MIIRTAMTTTGDDEMTIDHANDDTDDLRDEEAESRSSEADLAPRLKVGGATPLLGGVTTLLGGAPAPPLLHLSSS